MSYRHFEVAHYGIYLLIWYFLHHLSSLPGKLQIEVHLAALKALRVPLNGSILLHYR